VKIRHKQTGAVVGAKLTTEHPAARQLTLAAVLSTERKATSGILPVLVLSNGQAIDPATWSAMYELAGNDPRAAKALRAAGYSV
jgi:hypothetical protein